MGKIIKLEGRVLVPTQEPLQFTRSLSKAFWSCYQKNYSEIPLFPVRKNPKNENEFLVIDGHRRAAILDLFGIGNFEVYLTTDDQDLMCEIYPKKEIQNDKEEAILQTMNQNIIWRFNYIPELGEPRTFKEMREKYPPLKDIQTAKKYFESFL